MTNIVIVGAIQKQTFNTFNDKNVYVTVLLKKQKDLKSPNIHCISAISQESNNKYEYIEVQGNAVDYYALVHADIIYMDICDDMMIESYIYLKSALEMRMKVNTYQPLHLYYKDINKSQIELQVKEETTKEFDMWFDAYVVLQKYNEMF